MPFKEVFVSVDEVLEGGVNHEGEIRIGAPEVVLYKVKPSWVGKPNKYSA